MTGFLEAMIVPFTNEGLFVELLWRFALYLMLAAALDLVVGYTGMFQLGHIGFFALGALGTTIATHPDRLGMDLFAGLLLGAIFTTIAAVVIGLPTLRLQGDYFAIATMGFGLITQIIFFGLWAQGIFNVPSMNPLGCDLECMAANPVGGVVGGAAAWLLRLDTIPFAETRALELVIVWAFAWSSYLFLGRIKRAPFGRLLQAVREDPAAAMAMGKDVPALRFRAFWFSSLVTSVAGGLFVHHQTALVPTAYGFQFTVLVLVMIILGGLGNHFGALVGALAVTFVNEFSLGLTKWLGDTAPEAAAGFDLPSLRIILFAVILLLTMLLRPGGIMGEHDITMRRIVRWLRQPRAKQEDPR